MGDCVTCYQGADMVPDCTRQSVLYENVCSKCVPKAKEDKELKEEDIYKEGGSQSSMLMKPARV